MKFTHGKDRFYEDMMQQKPRFDKSTGGGGRKRKDGDNFKYTLADVDCKYCVSHKHCDHNLCPHIMDNLADLKADKAFIVALDNAENCDTEHRNTLIHLKENHLCQ